VTHHAFVAGATGYTGQALVAALREQGIATTAHVRPDSPRLDEHTARFEALGATVDTAAWEPTAMASTLAEHPPTLVFCLLGTTRHRVAAERRAGGDGQVYEDVDYGMTMMVVRAAEALSPPPRVVYLSAAGTKASRPGSYGEARWKVEQALQASSLPWTIARPCFITGPDRGESRPAERTVAALLDGLLYLGGRGARARWSSLSAEVLARGLVRHALDPTSDGLIVEAAGLRDLPAVG
jgi:uncharacterized protein YbjT (DUF2867 family)